MQFNSNLESKDSIQINIESKKRERPEENQDELSVKKNKTEGEFLENKVSELAQETFDQNIVVETNEIKNLSVLNAKNLQTPWQEKISLALENQDWNQIHIFIKKIIVEKWFQEKDFASLSTDESWGVEKEFPNLDINTPFVDGPFKGMTLFYCLVVLHQWNLATNMLQIGNLDMDKCPSNGELANITPLYCAAAGNSEGHAFAELMLNTNPTLNVNAVCLEGLDKGATPLTWAALQNAWGLVYKMLILNPNANVNACLLSGYHRGKTPLWLAGMHNQWTIVEIMLNCPNPDVHVFPLEDPTCMGNTLLSIASGCGHESGQILAEKILDLYPEVKIDTPTLSGEYEGFTPLAWAVLKKVFSLAHKMLDLNPDANINTRIVYGPNINKTPFVIALESVCLEPWNEENWKLLEKMVEMSTVDINACYSGGPFKGVTCLWAAVMAKKWEFVEKLLRRKDIKITSCPFKISSTPQSMPTSTPIFLRYAGNEEQIGHSLTENMLKLNPNELVLSGIDRGFTPVTWAATLGAWNIVKIMLDQNPDIDVEAVPQDGFLQNKSLFALALYAKKWKLIEQMLAINPNIDMNMTYPFGHIDGETTYLIYLAYKGQWQIIENILENNCHVNNFICDVKSLEGKTLLWHAFKDKKIEVMHKILDLKSNVDVNAEFNSETILWRAARKGYWDFVEKMLEKPNANALWAPDKGPYINISILNLASLANKWAIVQKILSLQSSSNLFLIEQNKKNVFIDNSINKIDEKFNREEIVTLSTSNPPLNIKISIANLLKLSSKVLKASDYNTIEAISNKIHINTDQYEEEVVREFVNYIKTVEVEITNKNVLPLFFMANEHEITSLRQLCLSYINENLTVDMMPEVLQLGLDYNLPDIIWTALSYALEQPKAFLKKMSLKDDCRENEEIYSIEVQSILNIIAKLTDESNMIKFKKNKEILLSEFLIENLSLVEQLIQHIKLPVALEIGKAIESEEFKKIAELCPSISHLTIDCSILPLEECKENLSKFQKLKSFGNAGLFFTTINSLENYLLKLEEIKLNTVRLYGSQIDAEALEMLQVLLPNLDQLVLVDSAVKEISFKNLNKIVVKNCNRLKRIDLPELTQAKISDCPKLSDISMPEVEYFTGSKIGVELLSLPKAKEVELEECTGIKKANYLDMSNLEFPIAKRIILDKCNSDFYKFEGCTESIFFPKVEELIVLKCNSIASISAPSLKMLKLEKDTSNNEKIRLTLPLSCKIEIS